MEPNGTIDVTVSPLEDKDSVSVTDYDSDRCLIQMDENAVGYASVFTADTEREFKISVDVRHGNPVTLFLVNLIDYMMNADIDSSHLFSQKEVNSASEKTLLPKGTYLLGVKQITETEPPKTGFESVLNITALA